MAKKKNYKPGSKQNSFTPDRIATFPVCESDTLMSFLQKAMPEKKRTTVKELLKHDQVAVNGYPKTQFDWPLEPGDEVAVNFVRPFHVFHNRRMQLVYEDDDIIVVNKGYGLLSVGTDKKSDGTAYSILKEYVKWNDPRCKVFVIHRLDQNTSGLMMFAKNEEAKNIMQHNWNNMVLNRKYVAVVEGKPEKPEGTIKSYLAENSAHEVYSTNDREKGKLAVTRYRTLKEGNGKSLLEVELDTGRKNQIRVHMKDNGTPISGDRRYGGSPNAIHRLALHAMTLRFVHPITRKEMNFSTPVPSSFEKLV
ncbi:MAG: RluA family pseudouridine synthase [Paramuribaculum sp.]|nr:RluA family pseudouridine synthase [Paramuribaculum sp.]